MRNIKFFSIFSITLLFGLFFAGAAQADTVNFDSSFGTSGKVIAPFGHDANTGKTAIQSDGKIVVVGNASNGSNRDWAITKYNSDGSLDSSFGNGGKVIKDFGFGDDSLNAVAIQTDGKIVVAGNSRGNSTTCSSNPNSFHTVCWTIARYNSNGTLDTTFGNGGIVFSNIRDGTDPENVSGLIIQSDGKIVAVGSAYDLGVVRYNTNGSENFKDLIVIPNSFSFPPTFFPNMPAGELGAGASAVRVQQDGKMLISGNAGDHMFLLRLNQNNSFDTSFGNGGLIRAGIMARENINDMLLQQDNNIVVAGGGCATDCSGGGDTFVARFTPNGSFDNSFGTNGSVIYSIAGNDAANSLTTQLDGKIILGGYEDTQSSAGLDFAIRRLNPDGTLDSTFGTNGSFITPIGQSNDAISSIALQTDEKLIAVGITSNGSYNDWVLARFSGLGSNQAPVLDPIGNRTVTEGELLQFTLSATDPDGDVLTYNATNLPPGAVFDAQTRTFSWTPGFDQEGNYENVEFTVTDNGSPMELDTELITITVGNVNRAPVFDPLGSQEVLEEQLLTFTVSATDPDGDSISLSASNLPQGASFDSQTGAFSWTPNLTQAGNYVVTFRETDNGIPSETGTLDVIITVGDNPTPTEQADTITITVINYDFPTNVENSYLSNLKKVAAFIEQGKIQPAINQLNAFIEKVEEDFANGIISQEERNNLINLAQALLNDLQ